MKKYVNKERAKDINEKIKERDKGNDDTKFQTKWQHMYKLKRNHMHIRWYNKYTNNKTTKMCKQRDNENMLIL